MSTCAFCNLIADDPGRIAEFETSIALVHYDQSYQGRTIVVLKPHFDHLTQVPHGLLNTFNHEMMAVAQVLETAFSPLRLNYACFGNSVNHIHWHLIPRYEGEPNQGRAPWPIQNRLYPSEEDRHNLALLIRAHLPEWSTPR